MNDNYPFDKIGKKMPYQMPEDFFTQMQANVLAEVAKEENEKRKAEQQNSVKLVSERQTSVKPRKAMLKRICLAAASIAACVCLVVGIGYSVLSSDGESKSSSASTVNVVSANASSASQHSVDKAYDNLTAEEQQELNATYANDVYLCME